MDYHLIIIGGGAAGKDAALFAARAGIKTLLVEKGELGGTSYYRGCYAMRALQACAAAAKTVERSEKFGIGIEFVDTGWAEWSRVRHRVTSRLTAQLGQDLKHRRRWGWKPSVVVLTGNLYEELQVKCKQFGAVAVLDKINGLDQVREVAAGLQSGLRNKSSESSSL
jgi:pyruvate/2-oxoglutarate dehydrogenase complex dihydrolipoamide dehydrogenase (E3) component